jgi:putative thioredoxin
LASLATPASEKAAIEAFRRDVVQASQSALVLVDFWAEWCGPCKTLGPLLDKVVASYAPRVKLVKIDVDKNQTLAAQFRIQSIPTVYAFLGGQPVDGFQGAIGERELKAFIERLLAGAPPNVDEASEAEQIAQLLAAARQASAAGAHDQACGMLAALAAELPQNEDIAAALALALIAAGRSAEAEAALAAIPADSKHADVVKARAALAIARDAKPVDNLDALEAGLAQAPDDHALRFEVANGWLARGDRDKAADHLLAIIKADRGWNEGAAREKLLKLFEAAGLSDPWSVATRARLRAILFS